VIRSSKPKTEEKGMASNYKVNANGKWRFFETEEQARRFCARHAEKTGVVLAVVATERSKKAAKDPEAEKKETTMQAIARVTRDAKAGKVAVCNKCQKQSDVGSAGCSHASCGGIFIAISKALVPKKALAEKAARPAAAAKKEVGPTEGILGLLARGPATTAEIHAAFPHTVKSDVTTRIRREGWTRQPARGRHEITAAGRKRLAELKGGR